MTRKALPAGGAFCFDEPKRHSTWSLLTVVFLPLFVLAASPSPAWALKCTTSSGTCYDTRTKEHRKCTTKVCTDDKGTVVSTETVVELKGGGGKPKVKTDLPKASTSGAATKQ
jgi:hypothetical protein